MIVHLRDNVQRLVRQAESSDRQSSGVFLRLLDQRRDWIKGELDVEGMLREAPTAPLGIPENMYDLAALTVEPVDERTRHYRQLLDLIDRAMGSLWDRMLSCDDPADA